MVKCDYNNTDETSMYNFWAWSKKPKSKAEHAHTQETGANERLCPKPHLSRLFRSEFPLPVLVCDLGRTRSLCKWYQQMRHQWVASDWCRVAWVLFWPLRASHQVAFLFKIFLYGSLVGSYVQSNNDSINSVPLRQWCIILMSVLAISLV